MTITEAMKEDLLDRFKDLEAIKFAKPGEEFTLKSGRKSKFYLDCRLVTLDAEGANLLAELFLESIGEQLDGLASEEPCTYIGSSGVGGAPIVGQILTHAGDMKLPWQGFIVRDAEKGHGLQKKIEGHYGSDGDIVLVEDVITTGGSILEAAAAIRYKGFNPIGVHCIIDREEGGREALKAAGLPLFSLLKLKDLLDLED
jgi:orotate phosphoribosyltransferase